jgi:hypothetical protein
LICDEDTAVAVRLVGAVGGVFDVVVLFALTTTPLDVVTAFRLSYAFAVYVYEFAVDRLSVAVYGDDVSVAMSVAPL